LQRLGVETQTTWFQQYEAMTHIVRTTMQVPNEMFPVHVISRRGYNAWPTRSPNLNVCDFFLWGYLKSKMYKKKPRTTVDLKKNIRDEMAALSHTMLQPVMQNFQKRSGNVLTTRDTTSHTLYSGSEYCNYNALRQS
jgi:hypothetical protein